MIALFNKFENIDLNDSLSVLRIRSSFIKFSTTNFFSTKRASIVLSILLISECGRSFSFFITRPPDSIFSSSKRSSIISLSLSELSNIDLVNLEVIFGSFILPE